MTRLLLLAAVLGAAGCSLVDDCSFDTEERQFTNVLRTDVAAVGDTLTVVVVNREPRDPAFQAFVPAGLALSTPSDDGSVQIGYDIEAEVSPRSRTPLLAATARGDTVYVYVEGTLDPSLFVQVCSPSEDRVRVDLLSVSAPPGVRALRVLRADQSSLSPAAAHALRQRDAARPARLLTV